MSPDPVLDGPTMDGFNRFDRAPRQRSRGWVLRAGVWSAFVFALARPAFGAAPTDDHAIHLVYRAFAGCPSEAEFLEQVGARIASPAAVTQSSQGQTIVVTLVPAQGEVLGRLETDAGGGEFGVRSVRGQSCAEVASALALFMALSIDPRAAASPTSTEDGVSMRPARVTSESNAIAAPAKSERAPSAAKGGEPRIHLFLGAGGVASGSLETGSVMPGTALGLNAFVELLAGDYGRHRINLIYLFEGGTEAAAFAALGARWDVAPVAFSMASQLELEPCVAAELLHVTATAHASGDITAGSATRIFVAADFFARARYRPGGTLLASLEAGVQVPLTRYAFRLGTESNDHGIIHEVPALGWMLGLQLGGPLL